MRVPKPQRVTVLWLRNMYEINYSAKLAIVCAIRSEVIIKGWYFYHEGHEDLEEETLPFLLYPSLPSWL